MIRHIILTGLIFFAHQANADTCEMLGRFAAGPAMYVSDRGTPIATNRWKAKHTFGPASCEIGQEDDDHWTSCISKHEGSASSVEYFDKMNAEFSNCFNMLPEKFGLKTTNSNSEDGSEKQRKKRWSMNAGERRFSVTMTRINDPDNDRNINIIRFSLFSN